VAYGDLTSTCAINRSGVRGERVQLTPSEYRLLYQLARNPMRVITKRVLCERVWAPSGTPRQTTSRLWYTVCGENWEINPRQPRYIENQRGMGYRFVARAEAAPLSNGSLTYGFVRQSNGENNRFVTACDLELTLFGYLRKLS